MKAVVVAKPKSARLARREASDEEEDEDAEGESDDEEDLEKIVLVAELETRMSEFVHRYRHSIAMTDSFPLGHFL